MTVVTSNDSDSYTGNGVTTIFPFTFKVFEPENLLVSITAPDDMYTELVLGTDYSVISINDSDGEIQLTSPVLVGYVLTISRNISAIQKTSFRNQGSFLPKIHENAFDYLTMLVQGALSTVSRALRYPLGGTNYDADNRRIVNMSDPVNAQDAATKNYVDDKVDPVIATVEDAKNIAVESKNIAVDAKNTAVAASETAVEARDEILAIGAVSLSADNIFTGQNTFNGGVIDAVTGIGRSTSKTINISSWADVVALKIGTLAYVNAASFTDWPLTIKYGVLKKIGSKIGESGDEPGSFYCEFQPYNSGEIYTIYRESSASAVILSGGVTRANARWYSKAIGEIVMFDYNFDLPPINLPDCRYITLSTNDSYNSDILIEQSITGTAPLITATAKINLPASPMHNSIIHLINTEGRYIVASPVENVVRDDAIQNIVGTITSISRQSSIPVDSSGALYITADNTGYAGYGTTGGSVINLGFNASRVVRTDTSTHGRDISRTYFMRIL